MSLKKNEFNGASAVFVLGMHRSGTSVVTKLLSVFDVYLGKHLIPASDENPKGFFEDKVFMHLNIRLLKSRIEVGDYGLFALDSKFVGVETIEKELLEHISGEYSQVKVWGCKDPRLCITFPVWKKLLETENILYSFIVPVRNPLEVAWSLQKRGLSVELGLMAWFIYSFKMLEHAKHAPACFLKHESLYQDLDGVIEKIAAFLGKSVEEYKGNIQDFKDNFLDPALHCNKTSNEEFEFACRDFPWIQKMYTHLQLLAESSVVSTADIDNVLNELQKDYEIFSSVLIKVARPYALDGLELLVAQINKTHAQHVASITDELHSSYATKLNELTAREQNVYLEALERAIKREQQFYSNSLAQIEQELRNEYAASVDQIKQHLNHKHIEQLAAQDGLYKKHVIDCNQEKNLYEATLQQVKQELLLALDEKKIWQTKNENIENQLVELMELFQEKSAKVADGWSQLSKANDNIMRLQEELAVSNAYIQSLKKSMSWKVTAPIRVAIDVILLTARLLFAVVTFNKSKFLNVLQELRWTLVGKLLYPIIIPPQLKRYINRRWSQER